MRFTLPMTALLVLFAANFAGCTKSDDSKEPVTTSEPKQAHPHSHEGGDALVWVEEGVEHEGFVLGLGHHGEHLHAASFVEPAVSITKDGTAVADAKVFNALVAADGTEVIREEVATVYEPESPDEPAHYAQGKLHLPKGSDQFILRFRIALPGVDEEFARDVTIAVEQ